METAFGECCDTDGMSPPVHAWFPLDRSFAEMAVLVASLGANIQHASIVSVVKAALLGRQHVSFKAKGDHSVLRDCVSTLSAAMRLMEGQSVEEEKLLLQMLSHGFPGGVTDAAPLMHGDAEAPAFEHGSTSGDSEFYEWGCIQGHGRNSAFGHAVCLSVVLCALSTHPGYVLPYHHWKQEPTYLHMAGADRKMAINSCLFVYVCNGRLHKDTRRGRVLLKVHALHKSAVAYKGHLTPSK